MLNRVTLIGRATREPDLSYTADGVPKALFTLAVDRPFTNAQGQREADFIPVLVWRKTAEVVGNYLTKGRLVCVEGRLQFRDYTTQDGQKRRAAEVVADTVQFLDRRREEPAAKAAPAEPLPPELAGEDMPF